MHALLSRIPVAALTLFLALAPLFQQSRAADTRTGATARPETTADRRVDLQHAFYAGSARRLPTAALQSRESSRAGGQPRHSLVSQAAYGEVVAEPLPEILGESVLPFPVAPESEMVGCGAEYPLAASAGCGAASCVSCSGGSGMGADPGWPSGCGAEPTCQAGPGRGMANVCAPLCLPMLHINWCRFEFFGGVQGFAGPANFAGSAASPADREGSTSFGVHEGLNEARPLPLFGNGLSAQLGVRAVQANFAGSAFTESERQQMFVTGGFFRRVDYGLQGGVVVDYLHDDWYYGLDLLQLRGEFSWLTGRCNEFGYGFMSGLSNDTSTGTIRGDDGTAEQVTVAMEALDQHRLFYRRHFREGGFAEMFVGLSGDNDGLLGAALELPLRSSLALRTGVTYLAADGSSDRPEYEEESWNLGVSLVWFPCGRCGWSQYHRPLLNVADNGTFLVGRQ